MKLKKLFALMLVVAFIMTLAPVSTLADELAGSSAGVSETAKKAESEAGKTSPATDGTSKSDGETKPDATTGESKPTGETKPDATTGESKPTGDAKPDATTGETKPTGDAKSDATTGESKPTGDAKPDATTGESKPTGDAKPDATTGESKPTGDAKPDATTGETKPTAEPKPTEKPLEEPKPKVPSMPEIPEATKALLLHLQEANTVADFWAALQAVTEEEWALLQKVLPEAMYAQYQEMSKMEKPVQEEPITVEQEGAEESPVPFTDVAPLLPPVSGPEMMKTRMTEELATPSPLMFRGPMGPAGARGLAATGPMGPTSTLAEYGPMGSTGTASTESKGLELSKHAEKDGERYKISLEAYMTGEYKSETTVEKIPSDIVLVLDESGSMAWNFPGQRDEYNKYYGRYEDAQYTDLYSRDATGTFKKVKVSETNPQFEGWYWVGGWDGYYAEYYSYIYTFSREGEETPFFTERRLPQDFINYGTKDNAIQIYTKKTSGSRKAALQQAATNFIKAVRADNDALVKQGKTGHRIAVVGFATGSHNITKELNAGNKTQGLLACTDPSILTAIDSLKANGATNSEAGMLEAKTIIENNPPQGTRNQVVVMFTDGEPTTSDSFSETVANGAIGYAKTLKANHASVYTIGVFGGADANDTTQKANRYMNYVSSNFKDAQNMETGGRRSGDGFYLVAAKSGDLNEIFDGLSKVVETGKPAMPDLDDKAVLKDVISPYFQIAGNIEVFTADCNGKDKDGTFTFAAKVPYDAERKVVDNNTIEVKGFNYSKYGNFVGPSADKKGYVGKKLIVEIPVKPIDGFFGGNAVPTNVDTSGVYNNDKPVKHFEEPKVDVPMSYQIEAENQAIYLGNPAELEGLLKYPAGYKPDEWNNHYVNIKYELKQGGTLVGAYTIDPGSALGSWSWKENHTPVLSSDTPYTLSCEVTPKNNPVNPASPGQKPISLEQTPTVYVYKPQLTLALSDVWADYQKPVDLAQWALGEGTSKVDNYKPVLSDTWVVSDAGKSVKPIGTAPGIGAFSDFTYEFATTEATGDAQLSNGSATTGKKDTNVTVKLKSYKINNNDKPFDADCKNVFTQYPNNQEYFTLHTNRFNLKVTKSHNAPEAYGAQSFLFHLTGEKVGLDLSFALARGMDEKLTMEKTMVGLLCGQSYTVSEDGKWSWRYDAKGETLADSETRHAEPSKSDPATPPKTIAFVNTLKNVQWLTGSAGMANIFGSKT